MQLVRKHEGEIIRPLRVLIPLIQQDIEEGNHAAETSSMPYYRAAGEKLIESKEHGFTKVEWNEWLKRHFNISLSTATRWMDYAEYESDADKTTEVRRRNFSSLTDFRRHISPKDASVQKENLPVRPQAWHNPIKETLNKVDTLALKQAQLKRDEERALQRQLALQLIDIGYKALASKLHPDKGGKGASKEAMTRLNQVRERLKGSA